MNNERVRSQKEPKDIRITETELKKTLAADTISTWEDISEELAQAYREEFHQGASSELQREQENEEAMLNSFAEAASALSPREVFVLRLRTGVLHETPMHPEEIAMLFPDKRAKQNRVRYLALASLEQIGELPKDALFDRAVLTALGRIPLDRSHKFSLERLSDLLGMSRETIRKEFFRTIEKISTRSELKRYIESNDQDA